VLETKVRLLDALGYSVVSALSGEEAIRLIDSHSEIDLILADYAMPAMSGVEFAKMIETARPALPVILVTGYGNRNVMPQRSTNTSEAMAKAHALRPTSAKRRPLI
jgi:CheY-like chemotaxis protein